MTLNPYSRAREALCACDVDTKLALVSALAARAERGELDWAIEHDGCAPDTPGRPSHPLLVEPRRLERRSTATPTGIAVLIHAVAHIEFNAINLALDAVCRFPQLPPEYYCDWVHVAV